MAAYRTQTGEYAKGPDKIKSALEKFFAENKGIQVKAELFDLQLESANRAIAKGLAVFGHRGRKRRSPFHCDKCEGKREMEAP